MKKPYLDRMQRLMVELQRSGTKTTTGALLELHLAWVRLKRTIERTIFEK